MSLDAIIATGSYTGNGTSQSIAIGWQPALVLTLGVRSGPALGRSINAKLPDMSDDDFIKCNTAATYTISNGLTITATGFDVGSDETLNNNNTTFHWIAIRQGPWVDTGIYTGDGSDPQPITTGRQPSAVIASGAVPTGTPDEQFFKMGSQPGADVASFVAAIATVSGITLTSTGFDATVNANVDTFGFAWMALYDIVGSTRHFESGTFTGDGNDPQSISLGRQPKFVMVFNATAPLYGLKSDTMPADDYGALNTQYDFDAQNGITLVADGFDVDSDFNATDDSNFFLVGYV